MFKKFNLRMITLQGVLGLAASGLPFLLPFLNTKQAGIAAAVISGVTSVIAAAKDPKPDTTPLTLVDNSKN